MHGFLMYKKHYFLTVKNHGLTIFLRKEGKIDEEIINNCFKFIACF